MAKPEWGVKRICPSCATRFYDLLSDPIVCPACNATFAIEAFSKPRRGKAAVKAAAPVDRR
ncbi:MAG: TIGR02300 family protein, partial [Pseudomonadota bacterium]